MLVAVSLVGVLALVMLALLIGVTLRDEEEADQSRRRPRRRRP